MKSLLLKARTLSLCLNRRPASLSAIFVPVSRTETWSSHHRRGDGRIQPKTFLSKYQIFHVVQQGSCPGLFCSGCWLKAFPSNDDRFREEFCRVLDPDWQRWSSSSSLFTNFVPAFLSSPFIPDFGSPSVFLKDEGFFWFDVTASFTVSSSSHLLSLC